MHDIKKAFSDSNLYILSGEFENAKSVFSSLLDYSPDDINYQIGYFTSCYWDNRLDIIYKTKEGKTRAFKLMSMLLEFKFEFGRRDYNKNESYNFLKERVLSVIVFQIKLANQQNEDLKNEFENLKLISYELIKIKKYELLLELLEIIKISTGDDPNFLILKAESLSKQNKKEQANIIFQKCFLNSNLNFSLEYIDTSPIKEFTEKVERITKNKVLVNELVCFFCIYNNYFEPLIEFKERDIKSHIKEINHLIDIKRNYFQENNKKIELDCKLFRLSYILLNQSNLHIDLINHIKVYYDNSKNNILYYFK